MIYQRYFILGELFLKNMKGRRNMHKWLLYSLDQTKFDTYFKDPYLNFMSLLFNIDIMFFMRKFIGFQNILLNSLQDLYVSI